MLYTKLDAQRRKQILNGFVQKSNVNNAMKQSVEEKSLAEDKKEKEEE